MNKKEMLEILRGKVLYESPETIQERLNEIADYLESGEPEHRWISVKDRMPELIPCKAGTAYSEAVVVLTELHKVITAVWDGIDWIGDFRMWEAEGERVTHWMSVLPLPKRRDEDETENHA